MPRRKPYRYPAIIRPVLSDRFLAFLVCLLLLSLFWLAATASHALADTPAPAPASTGVNLSSSLNMILDLAGTVLAGVGTWALSWLARRYQIQVDDQTRQYLNAAITNAINYGTARAKTAVSAKATITFSNPVVGHAVDYLNAHVPDALAHFGLNQEAVARLVLSRLPAA